MTSHPPRARIAKPGYDRTQQIPRPDFDLLRAHGKTGTISGSPSQEVFRFSDIRDAKSQSSSFYPEAQYLCLARDSETGTGRGHQRSRHADGVTSRSIS